MFKVGTFVFNISFYVPSLALYYPEACLPKPSLAWSYVCFLPLHCNWSRTNYFVLIEKSSTDELGVKVRSGATAKEDDECLLVGGVCPLRKRGNNKIFTEESLLDERLCTITVQAEI